jgi:exodeoxyribonuclease III
MSVKIFSYNVNGIRSACTKGLITWLQEAKPDIVCFQELKANVADIDTASFEALGYTCHWYSAQKKGYSGTGIISKVPLSNVTLGNNMKQADFEGRTISAVLNDVLLVNTYFPSGSSGSDRQDYKMEFLTEYLQWLKKQMKKYKHIVIAGDYNICHQAIDIHDPVGNKNSSGFLPEERAWMDDFFASGMLDAFRTVNPHPHQYSWWSYRANARANNKGWRIDYINVSKPMQALITDAYIMPDALHSDHCPIGLELEV